MSNPAALEFQDLFRTDDADDGLPVYDEQWRRPINPDESHPFEKFFHPELQASGNVTLTPDDRAAVESEEFRKAEDEIVERVLAKMKLFIEDVGGKRLLSERI
jgi:hypothetical protein